MPYIALAATGDSPELVIRYEIHGDRADAPVLLLVHELGGTLESWQPLATRLASAFRVIAFDQRGAGLSEKPLTPFTLWDLASDIGRVADALGATQPFALMGLAMGAVTATHFAARHADRLSALVLCDGTPSIDERSSKYLLERAGAVRRDGIRAVADSTFKTAFRGLEGIAANVDWQQYRQRFVANAPIAYAMQSEALAGCRLDDHDFARVRMPTLVLTGRHDCIWPPETGKALAARLPAATFEVVENAAHFPPLQHVAAVADRLQRFLGQAPA